MKSTLHILGFAGSLRKNSYNKGLLRAALDVLPEGMSLEIFDLADIPLYNDDVFNSEIPQAVIDFKARITASDALLIACPEYNYSMTGVLKNAIDWASRPPQESPLYGKPAAIMGAGGGQGTVRAQLHFRQVVVFTNILLMNKPEIAIPLAWENFDTQGNLTNETWKTRVAEFLVALDEWTRKMM